MEHIGSGQGSSQPRAWLDADPEGRARMWQMPSCCSPGIHRGAGLPVETPARTPGSSLTARISHGLLSAGFQSRFPPGAPSPGPGLCSSQRLLLGRPRDGNVSWKRPLLPLAAWRPGPLPLRPRAPWRGALRVQGPAALQEEPCKPWATGPWGHVQPSAWKPCLCPACGGRGSVPTAGWDPWDPAPCLGASVGGAGSHTGTGRRPPAISEPAVLRGPSMVPQGFPSATQTGCKSAGAMARKGTVGAGREKPGSRMKRKMQKPTSSPGAIACSGHAPQGAQTSPRKGENARRLQRCLEQLRQEHRKSATLLPLRTK